MLFELTSNITMGPLSFNGVHELHIKRSIHSYIDSAVITLPSLAAVKSSKRSYPDLVSTRKLFSDGDAVSFNLGYNGDVNSEFVGFIKSRGSDMPMTVECEGYVRQLRQNVNISKDFTKTNTTVADLLALAVQGTDISVQCTVNVPMSGVKFTNVNGMEILDWIKQACDRTLSIFFISARTLWCGIVYTPYANGTDLFNQGVAKYRMGWNVARQTNALRLKIPSEPVQVIFNSKLANGTGVHTASKDKAASNKYKALISHVPSKTEMAVFAQEKAYNMNYSGYEGKLTAFLQPYATPGMMCYIVDVYNSDLNGYYLIESTEVKFGVSGARRIIEVGPKLGFDNGE